MRLRYVNISDHNDSMQSLKAKIQAADERNEELASAVPETTRPLLRQIEALQAIHNERTRVWEESEKSLNARLNEAEYRAQLALERERSATDQLNQLVLTLLVF